MCCSWPLSSLTVVKTCLASIGHRSYTCSLRWELVCDGSKWCVIPPAQKRCPGPLCGVPCDGFHAGGTPRFPEFLGVRWAPCGKDHRLLLSSCGVFPEAFTALRGSPSCGRTACWVWFQMSGLSLSYLLSQLRSLGSSEHMPFPSCTG